MKQGFGVMQWPDGAVYEGLWENNLYNGAGKLKHANGDLYEGEFVDGKMQGAGTHVWGSDKTTHMGEYKEN